MRGLPPGAVAIDVGAGTGIFARELAARGLRVVALEPNPAMREHGADAGGEASGGSLTWVSAAAENTGLPDRCADLVASAQAFHWFRPQDALAEFGRILKVGGRLALVWNDRDEDDAFTRAYAEVFRDATDNPAAARQWIKIEPLRRSPLFKDLSEHVVPSHQDLGWEGLLGRAMSASYAPREGAAHERFVAQLRRAYDAWKRPSGHVRLKYLTRVYLAISASDAV